MREAQSAGGRRSGGGGRSSQGDRPVPEKQIQRGLTPVVLRGRSITSFDHSKARQMSGVFSAQSAARAQACWRIRQKKTSCASYGFARKLRAQLDAGESRCSSS